MLKNRNNVLAAFALVSQAAVAGQVDSNSLGLLDQSATFGNLLTGGHAGQTFSDRYAFTTNALGTLSADLVVHAGNSKNGLDIDSFSLYDAAGQLLSSNVLAKGAADLWSLSYDKLAAGSYYLQIEGSMLSNAAGRYNANLAFAPIPEPASLAIMAAGLGLLGQRARRRRQQPILVTSMPSTAWSAAPAWAARPGA